jgi:WD40 repeat protein
MVGGDNCMIFMYKATNDDQDPFEKIHSFNVKVHGEITKDISVKGLSMIPLAHGDEDKIVCSLSNNLVYRIKLKKDTFMSDHEDLTEMILPLNHNGAINGMDICVRKPLIATCGQDKCIKIWNYEERTLELSWSFNEEAHCLSFHPSGFHVSKHISYELQYNY